MKFKPEKKYFHMGLTFFLTSIAIMLAYFLFFRIDSLKSGIASINKILAPVFYGFILAYLMTPLMNIIENKFVRVLFEKEKWFSQSKNKDKHIRTTSVVLTMLIVVLVIYLFFASVIPQLYMSIQNLISQYSVYTENLVNWLNSVMEKNPDFAKFLSTLIYSYSNEADDFLNDVALPALKTFLLPNVNDILSSLTASVVKVIMFIWNIIIGLVISIYVLSGKEKFIQGSTRLCYATLETKTANRFIDAVRFTHHTFIGFLGGKVVDSAIIGILCYITLLIIKMPYALLVSVIVGVTNIIPFFGPYIGAIPSTLIILLVDPAKALTFVIFIIILQQIDGNIIGPKILAQSTGLTSFWIIFAITLFGGLFGVAGMIIGVPATAVIISFIDRYAKSRLRKKNLPENPENYLSVGRINEEGEITPYVYAKPEKKKQQKPTNLIKIFTVIWNGIKKICMVIVDIFKILITNLFSFIGKILNKVVKYIKSKFTHSK